MNAFFISCEMTRNSKLIGIPAAVAGNPQNRTGIVLAANYEARRFGVKTAMTLNNALKLCPTMTVVPPDHRFYRQKSSEVMNLLSKYTPIIEQSSIDEAWLDMTGTENLFGKPADAAKLIMEDIKENLGLWCSIGISEGKFLSKMASDMKKPLGITELWKRDIQTKLWPLSIKSMHGVGAKTYEKLHSLGIETIGDFANLKKDDAHQILGKFGLDLYHHAHGIDTTPVQVISPDDMKSIGRSTTLPEDLVDIEQLKYILLTLCEDIGRSARKHNKRGRTVNLTLKSSDFKVIHRQVTIKATFNTMEIYEAGYHLLKLHLNPKIPIRLIGVSISGFEDTSVPEQISIFNMDEFNKRDTIGNNRNEKIDMVMDSIRNKYGSDKISRASLIIK